MVVKLVLLAINVILVKLTLIEKDKIVNVNLVFTMMELMIYVNLV